MSTGASVRERPALSYAIRRSPYFERTLAAGAIDFMVYNHTYMPIDYGRDPVVEYEAITRGVTLWDVGAERQAQLRGPDALSFADYLSPRNLLDLAVGRCRFTPVCDPRGQVMADCIVLRPFDDTVWYSHSDADISLWAYGLALAQGADVEAADVADGLDGEAVEDVDQIEPRGTVEVTGAPLKGTVIQGKEIPQLMDELPILAVAGALASGTTTIRHAEELRVKETDRIAAIAHNLRAMGAQVLELNDGLEIHGRGSLRGARVASFGDHRIAMAFAVAGLFADGDTIVQDAQCVHESYPEFGKALEEIMNSKRVRMTTPVISSLAPSRASDDE